MGADEAPNGPRELVTQPIPGTQAWSEGVPGQRSVGERLKGRDHFIMFWETLKDQVSSRVRINCSIPALARGAPSMLLMNAERLESTLGHSAGPWMHMPNTNEIGCPVSLNERKCESTYFHVFLLQLYL